VFLSIKIKGLAILPALFVRVIADNANPCYTFIRKRNEMSEGGNYD